MHGSVSMTTLPSHNTKITCVPERPSRTLPPLPLTDVAPPVPDRPDTKGPLSARTTYENERRPSLPTSSGKFTPAAPRSNTESRSRPPIVLGGNKSGFSGAHSHRGDNSRNDNRSLPSTPKSSPDLAPKSATTTPTRRKPTTARERDLFPVKVSLPSGKQAILRCSSEVTLDTFTDNTIKKLKRYLTDSQTEYTLVSESGEDMDGSQVLLTLDYVKACIDSKRVPVLLLIVKGSNTRQQSNNNNNSVAEPNGEEDVARLVNEFQVAFLLPGGQTWNMTVSASDTIKSIKETLCQEVKTQKNAILLNHSSYEFHTYHKNKVLNDEEPIGSVPYIIKCRKRCTMPKLVLMQKQYEPFSQHEKRNIINIQSLIGRPMSLSDELEGYNFRATMARLRYLVRKRRKEGHASKNHRLSIHLADTSIPFDFNEKVMVSVTFPLLKFKKTIIVKPLETAEMFLKRAFEKYYLKHFPELKPDDFVLKVAGAREFIFGNHFFSGFEYVRKKSAKKEKIELVLCERASLFEFDPIEDEALEEQWQQGGEEMLDACTVQYCHEDVCSDKLGWNEKTHISIWEQNENFRVKLIGVEQLSTYCQSLAKLQEGSYLYVAAGLYHGGELISELKVSNKVSSEANPRWNLWFNFGVKMMNIPRACRLCLTLYGTTRIGRESQGGSKIAQNRRQEKEMTKDIPLAWVNCLLISYNHELRTGRVRIRMWRDEKANPIGTCVQNSDPTAPVLHLQFDEYQLPVVFPTKDPSTLPTTDIEGVQLGEEGFSMLQALQAIDTLISKDPLYPLTAEDKRLLWKHRKYCISQPASLPKFIASVPFNNRACVQEIHRLLAEWDPLPALDALELLDSRFPDSKVREFAVRCLESFADADLQSYLLQLVQVLKYEPYHDSALARFLMKRALSSQRVGHTFFWYLKAEIHVPEISERYALLLESYLHGCGTYLAELMKQHDILCSLESVANHIKTISSERRREVLVEQLKRIDLPDKFQLPLDPTWEAESFIYEGCKYMDSKKLPLWLTMKNADPTCAKPIVVIFKSGDDLRQDMLTLQIIRIMDKLWKSEGLDMQLSPYGCISTGDEVGMIEVVLDSATTAAITRSAGGATAAFKKSPIANWLSEYNRTPQEYDNAVNSFVHSCAGYCVATYVLGIGDRHNDNIMVQNNGRLFHIDFGHFLGNFKKKFGISRERAKFVFTPDFAYVMGGVGSEQFQKFVSLCCRAYNILRKHASRFINLLAMMLSTGIPELRKPKDIDYLRKNLCLDLDAQEAANSFCKELSSSLGCKTTIINNIIHILAH